MKACYKCRETKAYADFHKAAKTKDGYQDRCKVCDKEHNARYYQDNKENRKKKMAKYYAANKDKIKEKQARWRQANKERTQEYYEANIDYIKKYKAKWRQDNKGVVNAHNAKRKAIKLKATPAWADRDNILNMYNRASRANKFCEKYSLKVRFHVDHIIPLTHDKVCGLHVEDNLQVITAEENMKKSNKYKV